MPARGRTPTELRRRAEQRLSEACERDGALSPLDAVRLVHELRVHQIELELQNEELQASRAEVEELLRRYAELFDFAPVGFLLIGADGRIEAANFAAARLLDRPRGALIGRPLRPFVAAQEWAACDRLLTSVLTPVDEDATSESGELTLMCGREDGVVVRVTGAPLRAGAVRSALVALEDVTARKRAEDANREASRRKDEFLATLSHELRNPLAPIRNALTLLQRAPPGSERGGAALGIIDRQVAYLTHIVDDLLDVARVARGKIRLQLERRDLGELASKTVEDYRADFEGKGVVLRCDTAGAQLWSEVDPARIAQVIGNLLSNALKFTNPGNQVEVLLQAQDGAAMLRVRDTGVGIAPELMRRLFEPFSQGSQTLERSRGGLGLGLATVKGLVELHGGTVQVQRAGSGRGAEFLVRLPLAAQPQAPLDGVPILHPGAARRVLLIEDNADAAETLKCLLELHGHEVHVAGDGHSGISEARSFRPDVVVCDIGLPGLSGYDVARILRAEGGVDARPMLVALSGYASADDARRSLESGFDRHLAKPTPPDVIDRLLAEAPARAR